MGHLTPSILDEIQELVLIGKTVPFALAGNNNSKWNNLDHLYQARVGPIICSDDKAPPPLTLGGPPLPDISPDDPYHTTITWPYASFCYSGIVKNLSCRTSSKRIPSTELYLGVGMKASGLLVIDLDRKKYKGQDAEEHLQAHTAIRIGESVRDKTLTGLKRLREKLGDDTVIQLMESAVVSPTAGGGLHLYFDARDDNCSYNFPVYDITYLLQSAKEHKEIADGKQKRIEKSRAMWRMIVDHEHYKPIQAGLRGVNESLHGIECVDIRDAGGPGKAGSYVRVFEFDEIATPEDDREFAFNNIPNLYSPIHGSPFRSDLQRIPPALRAMLVVSKKEQAEDDKEKEDQEAEQDFYSVEIFHEWLQFIPASYAETYENCMRVALAMKYELPEEIWSRALKTYKRWCRRVPEKYDEQDVEELWESTTSKKSEDTYADVTGKTVRHWATEHGWKPLFQPGADLGDDHVLLLLMHAAPSQFLIVRDAQAYAEGEPQGTGLMGFDNTKQIWSYEAAASSMLVVGERLKRRVCFQHLVNPIGNMRKGKGRQIALSLRLLGTYNEGIRKAMNASSIAIANRARKKNWGDIINVSHDFDPRVIHFSDLDGDRDFIGIAGGVWNLAEGRMANDEELAKVHISCTTERVYIDPRRRRHDLLERVQQLDNVVPEDAREFMYGEVSDVILRRARRRFYILIGEGGIGKTTWLWGLNRALGGYYDTLDKRAIDEAHEDSTITEFRRSFWEALSWSVGLSDHLPKRMSSEVLKQVTGGDETRMRGMRVASAVMEVTAVPILACNDTSAPALFVDDQGLRQRLHVIPFVAPPKEDPDFIENSQVRYRVRRHILLCLDGSSV